jgi:hypothetical protein
MEEAAEREKDKAERETDGREGENWGGERKEKEKIKTNISSSGGELYRESRTAAPTRTDVVLRSACLVSSGEYNAVKKQKRQRRKMWRSGGGDQSGLICRCIPGIGKR